MNMILPVHDARKKAVVNKMVLKPQSNHLHSDDEETNVGARTPLNSTNFTVKLPAFYFAANKSFP